MKPLVVGEAPSKNEVTERPLEGRVGRRLADLCGLTLPEFLEQFERVNLLHVRQDTREKGFEFDDVEAWREAGILRAQGAFMQPRTVLLLGKRVARAFGCPTEYFARWWIDRAEAFVVPHPSGINRWWNDHANVDKAARFMRGIVAENAVAKDTIAKGSQCK